MVARAKTRVPWTCMTCNKPAFPGYVQIARSEPTRWQVTCTKCDQVSDALYHFETGQAQTFAQLKSWDAHMHGKVWVADTDWDAVTRGLSKHFGGM